MRTQTAPLAIAILLLFVVTTPADQPKREQASRKRITLDAIFGKILERATAELHSKFEIKDKIEAELLSEALSVNDNSPTGASSSISIVLFRPIESQESRKQYAFENRETRFDLRLTKVRTKHVSRPTAIVFYSQVNDGELTVEESILDFTVENKWVEKS